jgi:hypothetical protein
MSDEPVSYWPTTLDEAVEIIVGGTSDEHLAQLAAQPENSLIGHHFGWGMGIRNAFGLWGNPSLLASCGTDCADAASQTIIRAVWEVARERFPDAAAGEE